MSEQSPDLRASDAERENAAALELLVADVSVGSIVSGGLVARSRSSPPLIRKRLMSLLGGHSVRRGREGSRHAPQRGLRQSEHRGELGPWQ